MEDKIIKRVNMYFNLNDTQDKIIYEFLSSRSRKGPFAKELIYQHMLGVTLEANVPKRTLEVEVKKDDKEFSQSEIDNLAGLI